MNSWIAYNQSNGSGPDDANFDERVSDIIVETVGGRSRAASIFRSSHSTPPILQTSFDRFINQSLQQPNLQSDQFGPRQPFPPMQQYHQNSPDVSEDNFMRWHRHMIQSHPEPGNSARQLAKIVNELPSNRFCRVGSDQQAEPRRTGSSHSQAPMFRENGLSRRDAGQQTTPQPPFEQNYGQHSNWNGPAPAMNWFGPPPAANWNGPAPAMNWFGPPPASNWFGQPPTANWTGQPPTANWTGLAPPMNWFGQPPTQPEKIAQEAKQREKNAERKKLHDALEKFLDEHFSSADSSPTHHSLSQAYNANASRLPHQALAAQHFGSNPHHYQAHIPHVQQQHESAPFGHPPFFPQHCSQFCSTISSPNNARQQQSQFGHHHSSPSPIKRAPKSALKTPCRGASQAFSANGAHVTFGSPLFSVKLYTPPSGHSKSRQKRNHSREPNATPKRPLSSQRQAFFDRTNM